MSGDLWEKYRKKPVGAPGETPLPKTPVEYEAFGTKDRVERLKIKRANNPARAPGYAYLLDIVYDGDYGTSFILVYTFLIAHVRGRNLASIISAVEMGTAEYIQEFDPAKWQKPKDDKIPFIESIKVVVKESGPPIEETEKPGGQNLH